MLTTQELTALAMGTLLMLGPLAAVSFISPPTPDAPLAKVAPSEPRPTTAAPTAAGSVVETPVLPERAKSSTGSATGDGMQTPRK